MNRSGQNNMTQHGVSTVSFDNYSSSIPFKGGGEKNANRKWKEENSFETVIDPESRRKVIRKNMARSIANFSASHRKSV